MDYSQSALPKPVRRKRKNHVRKKITTERRGIEVECRGLTKILVHRRDGEVCLKCGTDGTRPRNPLQAAHILPKGKYPLLQFVLDNLLTLCYACHIGWAHKDPVGFLDWIEAKWPGRIQELRISASSAMKRKIDLKELLIVLQLETRG